MESHEYLLAPDGVRHSLSIFFFFKQKTAYEIRLSLVGSEMCIRDSLLLCDRVDLDDHAVDLVWHIVPVLLPVLASLVDLVQVLQHSVLVVDTQSQLAYECQRLGMGLEATPFDVADPVAHER